MFDFGIKDAEQVYGRLGSNADAPVLRWIHVGWAVTFISGVVVYVPTTEPYYIHWPNT